MKVKPKTKFNASDSTVAMDDDDRFSQERFDGIMDKIDRLGERVGIKINKKSKWISRSIIFTISVLIVGACCFAVALARKLFKKN
jgi:hypothetical protein